MDERGDRPAAADATRAPAASTAVSDELLQVRDLDFEIERDRHVTEILRGVSLSVRRRTMHGLVGETGSGKSMTARMISGLLPRGGRITRGSIRFDGRELVGLREAEFEPLRGAQIGMVFQNPRTALHPMLTIAKQMGNVLKAHGMESKQERRDRALDCLRLAGIGDPDRVAAAYPHELSGGLAQRAVIATVLTCEPSFIIADEPTTGLDVTVQLQILEALAELQSRLGLSVLMITHDLSIVSQFCETVSVMHRGVVVEDGATREIVRSPRQPYTRQLIDASKLDGIRAAGEAAALDAAGRPAAGVARSERSGDGPEIDVRSLRKRFRRRGMADVVAVDDVSFAVAPGTTLGLVGESGSGKSTVARLMLALEQADGGTVTISGNDVVAARGPELRALRQKLQIVFQEPFEALNPRRSVGDSIAEPLRLHTDLNGAAQRERVEQLLQLVQLDPSRYGRRPHELSGGEQQRVNIARALACGPEVIVLDEPTSSLDVSVRAEVLKLLISLQHQFGLTYVIISHDLPTIRSVCDEVAVMCRGEIVEHGPAEQVLSAPEHAYTRYLLSSALSLDPDVKPAPVGGWEPAER